MNRLIESIKQHEGYRKTLYLDTEGNLTGGWGHHFYAGSRLPQEVFETLFEQDLKSALVDYLKISPSLRNSLNAERKRVVVEMIFNMGLARVFQFRKFWAAVLEQDWSEAKAQLLDSRWHAQVGKRAETLAERFERGGSDDRLDLIPMAGGEQHDGI